MEQDSTPTDFLDVLGFEDFLQTKNHGRHRGPNPARTESQMKAMEKLTSKLYGKSGKLRKGSAEDEEEESVGFDTLSKDRVILLESKVRNFHTHFPLYMC